MDRNYPHLMHKLEDVFVDSNMWKLYPSLNLQKHFVLFLCYRRHPVKLDVDRRMTYNLSVAVNRQKGTPYRDPHKRNKKFTKYFLS